MAKVGAVVRITGSGFNAIDGSSFSLPPAPTPACNSLKLGNTCNPVNGTCVEFLDPSTSQWVPAQDVLGVTPTHLVVTSPIACSAPTAIRVTRLDALDPTGKTTVVADFCKN